MYHTMKLITLLRNILINKYQVSFKCNGIRIIQLNQYRIAYINYLHGKIINIGLNNGSINFTNFKGSAFPEAENALYHISKKAK